MKKKILLPFLAAFVSLFWSCSASLLDIQNENTLSSGNFWQTEDDIEYGVVSVYAMFYRQGTWTRNMYTQMNGMADDGVSYAGWTELNEYTKFIFTDYDFAETNTKMWQEHWTAVYRANQVLDNIDGIQFEDESHKNDLKGQTLWLRALYYYYLCMLWDNVPLILQTSSASDNPETRTADEVLTQIETDLETAIPLLPLVRDEDNTGRPTKGAAYGLLARAYAQHHKWDDAARCLEWIIEGEGSSIYDLEPNWADNFSNYTENNIESLYEIHFSLVNYVGYDQTDNPFDANAQLGTQIEQNQAPSGIGWNNIEARRWLVNYYKREITTNGTYDERLYYTLWYDEASTDFPGFDHLIYDSSWDTTWGSRCFIKKYSTDARPLYYWNNNNFRLIRLADMLLLYAEVLNEQNSAPTTKAVECLNRVRNRVNLPNIQESVYYDGTQIISDYNAFKEHIKIERALELALECVRWPDLKRWGIEDDETLSELRERDEDFDNFIIGKHIRMPIPQSDCDNNPNLQQNPNY